MCTGGVVGMGVEMLMTNLCMLILGFSLIMKCMCLGLTCERALQL